MKKQRRKHAAEFKAKVPLRRFCSSIVDTQALTSLPICGSATRATFFSAVPPSPLFLPFRLSGEWDALNLLTYIGSCDPFGRQGPEISGLHEQHGVRVYSDTASAKSAQAISARAYTVGHNILFAAGQ